MTFVETSSGCTKTSPKPCPLLGLSNTTGGMSDIILSGSKPAGSGPLSNVLFYKKNIYQKKGNKGNKGNESLNFFFHSPFVMRLPNFDIASNVNLKCEVRTTWKQPRIFDP